MTLRCPNPYLKGDFYISDSTGEVRANAVIRDRAAGFRKRVGEIIFFFRRFLDQPAGIEMDFVQLSPHWCVSQLSLVYLERTINSSRLVPGRSIIST